MWRLNGGFRRGAQAAHAAAGMGTVCGGGLKKPDVEDIMTS